MDSRDINKRNGIIMYILKNQLQHAHITKTTTNKTKTTDDDELVEEIKESTRRTGYKIGVPHLLFRVEV